MGFFAKQQELANEQKKILETRQTELEKGFTAMSTTSSQQELANILEQNKIKEKMDAFNVIRDKILTKQQALNLGLQQEEERIAPMGIIGRRQQKLRDQAANELAALSVSAQVLQGDIETARYFAELSFNALQNDKSRQLNAYQFLLQMNKQDIISLKADEKDAVNSQISLIQNAITQADKNKDEVLNLIIQNPTAAVQAGIGLTDDIASAVQKITPYIVQQEQKKTEQALVLDYAQKYSDAGILPTDSLVAAQTKLQGSKIYQQQTRLAEEKGKKVPSPTKITQPTTFDLETRRRKIQSLIDKGIAPSQAREQVLAEEKKQTNQLDYNDL